MNAYDMLRRSVSAIVQSPFVGTCTSGCGKKVPSKGDQCSDCYYKELGDLVEAYPPRGPRVRG